jgi:hypothetical protein
MEVLKTEIRADHRFDFAARTTLAEYAEAGR